MISRIFYSDKKIKDMEIINRWYESVEYICELYEENKDKVIAEEIVCLGLFQCWALFSYLSTNSVARISICANYNFYVEKWKEFFLIALDKYLDSPSVCWVAGYTASRHNVHFGKVFIPLGENLMKRGVSLGSMDFPFDLLMGKKRRDINDLYCVRSEILFPSEIEADRFFRKQLSAVFEVLLNKTV